MLDGDGWRSLSGTRRQKTRDVRQYILKKGWNFYIRKSGSSRGLYDKFC